MTVSARISTVRKDFEAFIDNALSPAAAGQAIAAFARKELLSAQKTNSAILGHVPSHETFVNGQKSLVLENAAPDGVIVFRFDLLAEVFAWVATQLQKHSPVKTGRFAASHDFFADGVLADVRAAPQSAKEYVFISPLPYARKLERGLSPQAPKRDHGSVYEAVALLAKGRFGRFTEIRYVFRETIGTGGIGHLAPKARREVLRDSRNPAISIKAR